MIRTSTVLACALVAAGIAGAAVGGEPEVPAPVPAQPVLFMAQSRIEVDASGAVVAVDSSTALPPAVNAALVENLRKVRFSPALKDGHAVAGVTYARQEACAIPAGDNYRMVVRYLGNGPGSPKSQGSLIRPRFPADAQMAGASASVKVAYRVMPDGSLSIQDVDLVSGRGHFARAFVSATRTWLEAQRAEPEMLDGQPVATEVAFTMEFRSGGESFTGPNARRLAEQHTQAAMEKDRLARIAASKACSSAAREPDSGQHVAVNSPFRALLDEPALQ